MSESSQYDRRILDPFDGHVHGRISRRQFLDGAAAIAASGVSAAALLGALGPNYGLAVRIPDLAGAVPYYGRQAETTDVPKVTAPLLIRDAGLDERVTAGWPACNDALDGAGKAYEVRSYGGTNHGFHNDTTPRYDPAAAGLSSWRTMEFFARNLV